MGLLIVNFRMVNFKGELLFAFMQPKLLINYEIYLKSGLDLKTHLWQQSGLPKIVGDPCHSHLATFSPLVLTVVLKWLAAVRVRSHDVVMSRA